MERRYLWHGYSQKKSNSRLSYISSPVGIYRKSYCTTPGVSVGVNGIVGVSKMLKFYVYVLC